MLRVGVLCVERRRPEAAFAPPPRWENIVTVYVTILLTIVPDNVIWEFISFSQGRLPEEAER